MYTAKVAAVKSSLDAYVFKRDASLHAVWSVESVAAPPVRKKQTKTAYGDDVASAKPVYHLLMGSHFASDANATTIKMDVLFRGTAVPRFQYKPVRSSVAGKRGGKTRWGSTPTPIEWVVSAHSRAFGPTCKVEAAAMGRPIACTCPDWAFVRFNRPFGKGSTSTKKRTAAAQKAMDDRRNALVPNGCKHMIAFTLQAADGLTAN